jgi:hypothetical protein
MSGACHYCGFQTMTVHGSKGPKGVDRRPEPDPGYRLGYVRETCLGSWLICRACFVNKLPSSIAA